MWLLYNGPDSDPSRVVLRNGHARLPPPDGHRARVHLAVRRANPAVATAPRAARDRGARHHDLALRLAPGLRPRSSTGAAISRPSFCFAVLIAAVAHPRTLIGKAFGVTPLRWIGERSYGMYLWHWPIIVAHSPRVEFVDRLEVILTQAALITVGAAALSYRFVEQPIRTGRAPEAAREVRPASARGSGPGRGRGCTRRHVRDPLRRSERDERASGVRPARQHTTTPRSTTARTGHPRPADQAEAPARPLPRDGRLRHGRLPVFAGGGARLPRPCRRLGRPADR